MKNTKLDKCLGLNPTEEKDSHSLKAKNAPSNILRVNERELKRITLAEIASIKRTGKEVMQLTGPIIIPAQFKGRGVDLEGALAHNGNYSAKCPVDANAYMEGESAYSLQSGGGSFEGVILEKAHVPIVFYRIS